MMLPSKWGSSSRMSQEVKSIFAWERPCLLLVCISALLFSASARAQVAVTNCAPQALISAITNAGGGTVSFTNNCSMSLSGTISINTNVTIDAAGFNVSLSGNNSSRLFAIQPGVSVTFIGIVFTGGQNTNGGAIVISSGANVTLTNCTFSANHGPGLNGFAGNDGSDGSNAGGNGTSGTAGGAAYGGALYNLGNLTVQRCLFLTNGVTGGSGGAGGNGGNGSFNGGNGGGGGAAAQAFGGAIYNLGTINITDSTFAGNTALGGNGGAAGAGGAGAAPGTGGSSAAGAPAAGGAIYNVGTLRVSSSTFTLNAASGGNGADGADQFRNGSAGKNGADGFGGAIFSSGSGSFTNSTFVANGATGGNGGNGGNAPAPNGFTGGNGGNGGNGTGGHLLSSNSFTVINCTFFGGSAQGGSNGIGGLSAANGSNGSKGASRGGNLANGFGTFSIQASIVASNLVGSNGFGVFSDLGYNISSDASVATAGTSLKNTNPRLSPLADNTGPSATMALISGSPAIDRQPVNIGPDVDQRGIPRPQGSAKDVGAYELVTVPFIVTQPTTQTQAIGGTVTFTVQALGPSLTYQWEFNSSFIPGATNSSYTIANVDFPDQGNYDVIITNSFGSVVSDTVTIRFSPSITQQPTNQTVLPGTNATFNVTAIGDPPLTYQWYFNSTNPIPGATAATLIISNPQINNAGPYSVVVFNPFGAATSSIATLTVNTAPIITNQPANQTVATNTVATFRVGAIGAQPLSYQWRVNGSPIPVTGTAAAYSRTAFATNNGEIYDVVITNSLGAVTSSPARLTVVSGPVVAGRIFNGLAGLGGVRVALTNIATGLGTNVISEADGGYTIYNLATNRSTNTLSASADCYLFGPTNATPTNFVISVGPANATGIDLLVTNNNCFLLSGSVTNSNGSGMSGVQITLTNSAAGFSTNLPTDSTGAWSTTLHPGAYTVTPLASNPCVQFSPASRAVILGPSSNGVSFQASSSGSLVLRGSVTKGTAGVSSVLISANGQTALTDSNGNYAISNLCPNSYSLVPSLAGFTFQPSTIKTNISASANNLNFTATPAFTLTKTNGGFVALAFPALTSSRIEASSNLTNWTTLLATDNFSAATLVLQFTDTNAPSFRARYYRVAENIAGLPRLSISNRSSPLSLVPTQITNCQIFASTNLTDWTLIFSTNYSFSNAPFQYADPQAITLPFRYYRLSQSPGF